MCNSDARPRNTEEKFLPHVIDLKVSCVSIILIEDKNVNSCIRETFKLRSEISNKKLDVTHKPSRTVKLILLRYFLLVAKIFGSPGTKIRLYFYNLRLHSA